MASDIARPTTDDAPDLTVQIVQDRATGRIAIGLTGGAAHALFELLDAMSLQPHDLDYDLGFNDRGDAERISTVATDIHAELRALLPGY